MTCRSQKGAALVVAVFLIVVLSALGTVAVKLTAVQQHTVNLALLSERALLAARTGIQWSAHRALTGGVCASATMTLTEAALNGFTVEIDCTSTAHAEGSSVTTVYRVESFAHAGIYGNPDYVSRRVTAMLSRTL